MLRNVLDGYLDGIRERELDLPLLLLLPALGFHDVHLTHGPVEFGRDLIAKTWEADVEVQYSFQSKVGNISQRAWRNEIRGQIETALWSSLSHPNFNCQLPHQVVLICTGDLRHNAAIELQEFNATIGDRHKWRPVMFWNKQHLVDLLLDSGLDGIYSKTATGFVDFGRFFLIYARALQGVITMKEIEIYSRHWSGAEVQEERRLLLTGIEAEVLAQLCISHDLVYEAVQLHLARLRLLCELSYGKNREEIRSLWQPAIERLYELASTYVDRIWNAWADDRDLVNTWFGEVYITTYPVQCARIMELASLAYFTARQDQDRERLASFVREFVETEPGCAHPIGDRYGVSLVLATLVLIDGNYLHQAASLLERAVVWICDRYEAGVGLAGIEADEHSETDVLLGYPFEFIEILRRPSSLLATIVSDLAALVNDEDLYSDIVNDFKASGVVAEYWQPRDTVGACRVEGDDVLYYPSVGFADELGRPDQDYAEHVRFELSSFRFTDFFGPISAVTLMSVLRDRYFPGLWGKILSVRSN